MLKEVKKNVLTAPTVASVKSLGQIDLINVTLLDVGLGLLDFSDVRLAAQVGRECNRVIRLGMAALRLHSVLDCVFPELGLADGTFVGAQSVGAQACSDDELLVQMMIKDEERIVKTYVTIGEIEIVRSPTWSLRFDKTLEIIAPVTKTPPQRKRGVVFGHGREGGHQFLKQIPRISV